MGNAEKIWGYLLAHGLTENACFGLMGNLQAESAFDPHNLQNTYEKKLHTTDEEYTAAVDAGVYQDFATDSAGYGLAQWTSAGRKQGLLQFARSRKKSIGDLSTQLDYLMVELNGAYKSVLKAINAVGNIREASDIVLTKFERPRDQSSGVKKYRASLGEALYAEYRAKNPAKKDVSEVAREVVDGKWGNGAARKNALTAAGWDYAEVQQAVNRILKGGAT